MYGPGAHPGVASGLQHPPKSKLKKLLDFKLSLWSVLTVLTFGCFPSVNFKPLKMDLTEGSETSANINQTLGKHPKVNTLKQLILQTL
jgi:hypothetical protein